METVDVQTALGLFRVPAAGTITRALQAGEWWDDHLRPVLDSVQGGWAVDIGAHFGWFTHYLATRHGRVFAVEPWAPTFQLLQHNTWMTPHGVQCWPVAAYHVPTRLGFAYRNDLSDAGTFGFNTHDFTDVSVVGVPLDMYLPHDAPISLIKCDAQGADLQALQGLRGTIRRCRPTIVFEWEEGLAQDQRSTWGDYLQFFAQLEYTVERITVDYWDFVARPQ